MLLWSLELETGRSNLVPVPSKNPTKALLRRLKDANPSSLPPSNRPITLDEVVVLLAQASSGENLNAAEEAMLPILLRQHERLSELVRKLAVDGRPQRVAKVAREALIESTLCDVQALNSMSPAKLRAHARHRTQFPAMAGGHPKWQAEIVRRVSEIKLGDTVTGCHLESRSKLDVFRKEANKIRDRLILQLVDLDRAEWSSIRPVASKVLDGLIKKCPDRFHDLRKLIKTPSDQGNNARLDARVKERILERLKTAIGANK